jgi:hypothetical protein
MTDEMAELLIGELARIADALEKLAKPIHYDKIRGPYYQTMAAPE